MDKERLMINSKLKRGRMCGPFLLSYAASWTRPRPSLPDGGARPGRPLRPAWHGTGGKVLPGRGTR